MLKILLITISLIFSAELTTSEKLKELDNAGQFVRKTTFLLSRCFLKDDTSRFISANESDEFLRMFSEALASNNRLYNDKLPSVVENKLLSILSDRAVSDTAQFRLTLERAFNESYPESLASYIESSSMKRAEHLLNDQQKNSFFTMKAKESGVTATEISIMLQSGYLICPMVKKIERKTDTTGFKIQCGPGMTIFNISLNKDGKIELKCIDDFLVRAYGKVTFKDFNAGIQKKKYPVSTTIEQAAVMEMVKGGQEGLVLRLRENDQFRMTAQVADAGFFTLSMQMPRKEAKDICPSDFYRLLELEDNNGTIVKNRIGWFFVNKLDMNSTAEGDEGNVAIDGRMVSGRASTGVLVQELPLSKALLSISVDQKNYAVEIDSFRSSNGNLWFDSLKVNNPLKGIGLALFLYTSKKGGSLDQFGLTASYTTSSMSGKISMNDTVTGNDSINITDPSFTVMHAGLTYQRSFPSFRRLFYGLYFSADYELTSFEGKAMEPGIALDTAEYDFTLKTSNIAGGVGGYSELYLFPSLSLGARAGYRFSFPIQKWSLTLKEGKEEKLKEDKAYEIDDGITSKGLEIYLYFKINMWPLTKFTSAIMNR